LLSDNLLKIRFLLDIEGIGIYRVLSLLQKFNTLDDIFSASLSELFSVDGISKTIAQNILSSQDKINLLKNKLEEESNILEKLDADILTYFDANYPAILKKIYLPPLILYTLGNLCDKDNYSVAIVGTRNPTSYGKSAARKFAGELAEQDITIVSGLARGIDSIAHETSLNAGGRTIAVTGSGLDVIYPPENKRLYERIKEQGVIVTEFEPGTKPDAQNFPKRNRIISGLSLGTLVIETALKGGAMQTAAYALDQNREIFAVPGNIGVEQSTGCNILIQKGEAKLVKNVDDIIEELKIKNLSKKDKQKPKPEEELNFFEEKILDLLNEKELQIDEISIKSQISTADCLVHLLSLEFKGLVRQLPGKVFTAD